LSKEKKILVVRFNAIGDIILTSPVTKALHNLGSEVHYLCKDVFKEILESRPDVIKVWCIKSDVSEVISDLKNEQFDFIVDLHNNLRSKQIKSALRIKAFTLQKPRIKNLLLTQFGVNKLSGKHIVNRFLDVVKPLGITYENASLDYFFGPLDNLSSLPEKFVSIAVGAAYYTKQIPIDKLVQVIDGLDSEIVLIGGPDDVDLALAIQNKVSKKLINLVGKINISSSAKVIAQSDVLISGDTGMMHLAAALKKSVVAVFGSTHPVLGYTPFYGNAEIPFSIVQNESLKCRPCTKQGKNSCPKGHFKCMIDLDVQQIIDKTTALV